MSTLAGSRRGLLEPSGSDQAERLPGTGGSAPTSKDCGPSPSCWSCSTTPGSRARRAVTSASTSSSSSPDSSSPGCSSGSGRRRIGPRPRLLRPTGPADPPGRHPGDRGHGGGHLRRPRAGHGRPDRRRCPVGGGVPGQLPLRRHRNQLPVGHSASVAAAELLVARRRGAVLPGLSRPSSWSWPGSGPPRCGSDWPLVLAAIIAVCSCCPVDPDGDESRPSPTSRR